MREQGAPTSSPRPPSACRASCRPRLVSPGKAPASLRSRPEGCGPAAVPAGFRSGPARRQLPLGLLSPLWAPHAAGPRSGRPDLGAPGRRPGSALLRGLQTGGRVSPSAGVGIRARQKFSGVRGATSEGTRGDGILRAGGTQRGSRGAPSGTGRRKPGFEECGIVRRRERKRQRNRLFIPRSSGQGFSILTVP